MIDLGDNLGRKLELREIKRERGLGFNKRFFELKSEDETADFISL